MINSLCFSPDVDKLFLIENDQVLSFSLMQANGVLIGKLGNQIVVATSPGDTKDETIQVNEYPIDKRQLQIVYSKTFKKAFVIIVEDLDFNKPMEEKATYSATPKDYDLEKYNMLVKRVENKLQVKLVKKRVIPVSAPPVDM